MSSPVPDISLSSRANRLVADPLISFDADAAVTNDLHLSRCVVLDGFGEQFGRAAGRFGAEGGEAVADVGGLEDAVDVGVEFAHDVLRGAGGGEDAVSGEDFKTG